MPSPSLPAPGSASGLLIGLDLGTSGLKALAVQADGTVAARAAAPYPTARPEWGAAEQDPGDWIRAATLALSTLAQHTDATRWSAVGLSGMLPTLVALDARGEHVGASLTWEDARAEEHGDALRDAVGADELYATTGQWVDGRYLLPMVAGVVERSPALRDRIHMVAGAKDFLLAWLTGELLTDPSTAAGVGCFDLAAGRWDERIREVDATLNGGLRPELPVVVPGTHRVAMRGDLATALGLPGQIPVCVGAADSVLGALGLGTATPGDVAYIAGTSTIILGVRDDNGPSAAWVDAEHRFLVTPMGEPGSMGLEMDLLATGSAVRWLADLLGAHDEATLMGWAAAVAPGEAPGFLPYLAPGEQGALWDPHLTGVLTGMSLAHGRGHLARALINGIALESRRCLRVLEDHGFARGELRVAGGSAADPWFRQQLADATGWNVSAPESDPDRSALGAALLAGRALGWSVRAADEGDARSKLCHPQNEDVWNVLADQHDHALASLRAFNAR